MRIIPALILLAAVFLSIAALADDRYRAALEEWKVPVTTGAASGYVPDTACAMCHDDKAESFRDVGMGKSFYRPSPDKIIEDFTNSHFLHQPSGRQYEMEIRDGEYWFHRYQIATDGTRINEFEQKVDWILGSGNHTRIYLYQTADGAMFELPLAWYSQESKWQMAPGFEWGRHLGVMRTVHRQCMFCHNAFPEVAAGSDRLGLPETFPHALPEGIGCQRCHGPGARHAGLALDGEADISTIRAAITNPSKLPSRQLYSICYGCHMQPAVAVTGVRRFGRNAYGFRPGEILSQFRTDMDMTDPGLPDDKRFEINHHPYRLEQSECFIQSGGELGCLTCHDPHRKIKPAERADHYRAACLGCHDTDDAGLPKMKLPDAAHPEISADADCTGCHMPLRRTQDVIHVTMTDHRIIRSYGDGDPLALLAKRESQIESIILHEREHGLEPDEAVMMKAIAVLHSTNGQAKHAANRLGELLQSKPPTHFEPWYVLADALIRQRQFASALKIISESEQRTGPHSDLQEMRAVALFESGNRDAGIAALENLLSKQPDLAISRYRLAVMYAGAGKYKDAVNEARLVLKLRHNHWPAWRLIGELAVEENDLMKAAEAFRNALAIEPADERTRTGLVTTLKALGSDVEASRYGQ